MKKTILFSAAALMVVAACSKQEASQPESKVFSLQASMEQQVDPNASKTSLGAGNTVIWSDGDEILVYDNASTPNSVTLTADAGGATVAHFVGEGSLAGTPSYAIFPAAKAESATSAGVITFTLPETQKYAVDSFDPAGNVMVGEVSGGNVSFKNTCGILKLQLKGVMKVGKIELTTKGSEKLYGTFTATATAVEPSTSYVSGGGDTIILDCDDEGGVQLDAITATNFYFVVPVGAFATGFTATVYDVASYSDSKFNVALTAGTNTISRKTIKTMPNACVSLAPANYTEIKFLRNTNDKTQYLNTGITPGLNYSMELDFQWNSGYGIAGCRGPVQGRDAFTINIMNTNQFCSSFGNTLNTNVGTADHLRHLFKISKNALVFDGVTTTIDATNLAGQGPVMLFAFTSNKGSGNYIEYTSYLSIYRAQIWNGSSTVSYLIPVSRNSDSALGLYDVVSGSFLENQGPGSFNSGGVLDVDVTFQKPAV